MPPLPDLAAIDAGADLGRRLVLTVALLVIVFVFR